MIIWKIIITSISKVEVGCDHQKDIKMDNLLSEFLTDSLTYTENYSLANYHETVLPHYPIHAFMLLRSYTFVTFFFWLWFFVLFFPPVAFTLEASLCVCHFLVFLRLWFYFPIYWGFSLDNTLNEQSLSSPYSISPRDVLLYHHCRQVPRGPLPQLKLFC